MGRVLYPGRSRREHRGPRGGARPLSHRAGRRAHHPLRPHGVPRLRGQARGHGFLECGQRSRAGAVGHRGQAPWSPRARAPGRGLPGAHPRLCQWLVRPRGPRRVRGAGAGDGGPRLHRAQVRPVSRAVAYAYPARGGGAGGGHGGRGARGRRSPDRSPHRSAPAPRPHACRAHRPRPGALPALLVRGAGLLDESGGPRGVSRADRHSHRDGRGALHARGVPPRLRAARGRHRQSRRVQLRRHHGAARHRPDGRALVRDRVAPQLQQHHRGAGSHPAGLRSHSELPHHGVFRDLRGARAGDRAAGLRGPPRLHRGSRAARPRPRARRGRAPELSRPAISSARAIAVPERPGLGLELDEDALRNFPARQFPPRGLSTPATEGP